MLSSQSHTSSRKGRDPRINLVISQRLIDQVDALADRSGLSRAALMRLAVARMIDDPSHLLVIPSQA